MIHTVKGFGIVNQAEVDVFLELSCFFDDAMDVGNLISGSSACSKFSLNIWKFTIHVLLKPGLENFKCYFANMRDEWNCVVVWTIFGISFLWDWNENWMEYYSGIKKEQNNVICRYMSEPRDCHIKWSKLDTDKYHMILLICGIFTKKGTNELIYKPEAVSQIWKTNLWLLGGKRDG